ncbi:MAG: aryldialkylphosphatase [Methylocystis sp.]|nr:aryldialkylphosphatase [Methylocystis sp.]MCA3585045.1 aryldialkylphosphatase [Methylocystis sp.]MCA3592263.1 aryldialkylphosphatase [Methylocystis sp.]
MAATGTEIMTVTGPMAPESLGLTLMHEHILCDLTNPAWRGNGAPPLEISLANRHELDYRPMVPGHHVLQDEAVAAHDLEAFRTAGGQAVVDLTTGGIGPDPEGLARLSRRTGVAIVLGAGFYTDAYVDEATKALSVEALAEIIEAQLLEGAWGTPIRCGVIGEIGVSWPMTPFEKRALQAAARAQSRTGAMINVHPGRHPDACNEICDVLEAAGADLSRLVMSHMDRTHPEDVDAVAALARRCIVEYDFFGIETSQYWMGIVDLPNDWMRLRALRRLFDAGLGHRICISHDICTRTRLIANGGHGYRHIPANVTGLMRDRGWHADEIGQLLVETPRRLLAMPG